MEEEDTNFRLKEYMPSAIASLTISIYIFYIGIYEPGIIPGIYYFLFAIVTGAALIKLSGELRESYKLNHFLFKIIFFILALLATGVMDLAILEKFSTLV